MLTVSAMHCGNAGMTFVGTFATCSTRAYRSLEPLDGRGLLFTKTCRCCSPSGVDATSFCEMPSSLNHDLGGGLDGGGTGVARCRFNIVLISHTVGRGRNPSGVTGVGAAAPWAGPFAFAEQLEDVKGENSAGICMGAAASWDVVGSDCVIATFCRCISLPAASSGGVAKVSLVADVGLPSARRSVCLRRGVWGDLPS